MVLVLHLCDLPLTIISETKFFFFFLEHNQTGKALKLSVGLQRVTSSALSSGLKLICCLTISKLLNHPVPCFPCCKMEIVEFLSLIWVCVSLSVH